jgi:ABC-type glycerol-3-phosphate transport system substrate-binding protein
LIVLILVSLTGAGLAGCRFSRQSSFPTLGSRQTQQTNGTNGTETEPSDRGTITEPVRLRLAVPFGEATAEALRLLFLARESGLMAVDREQYIGHQVSLDDLRQFDAPLSFEIVQVSAARGITTEQVRAWQASGSLPDLMYCAATAAVPGLSKVLTLDNLLYDHELLSPAFVYTMAVDVMRRGQALYGIPYLASIPLVCHNVAMLDQLQVRTPPQNWSWAQWTQWMADVQRALSDRMLGAAPIDLAELADLPEDPEAVQTRLGEAVFIYNDLTDFLPFVAPSLSNLAGWGMWNGYAFELDSPAFHTAAAWLRQQVQSGYAMNHLDSSQRQIVQSGTDSLFSDRVISRIVDSTELSYWYQKEGMRVSLSFLPSGPISDKSSAGAAGDDQVRHPVHIRSLVVSRTAEEPDLTARLAAFIALDPDALLLQSRFEVYEGLFPLVRDAFVWQAMVTNQLYGSQLPSVRAHLAHAYSGGQQMVISWDKIMQDALKRDAGAYMTAGPDVDLERVFDQIMATASQLLNEGG